MHMTTYMKSYASCWIHVCTVMYMNMYCVYTIDMHIVFVHVTIPSTSAYYGFIPVARRVSHYNMINYDHRVGDMHIYISTPSDLVDQVIPQLSFLNPMN